MSAEAILPLTRPEPPPQADAPVRDAGAARRAAQVLTAVAAQVAAASDTEPLLLDARQKEAIANVARGAGVTDARQRAQLDLLKEMRSIYYGESTEID